MVDLAMTQAFLDVLGSPPFIFQTFTDSKERKKTQARDPLARVLIGTLEEHSKQLQALSHNGAGVFVQVNAGEERGKDAVTQIRSLVVDLDTPETMTESMQSLAAYMPKPTCIVKSSPGKCHIYWSVDDCPLDKFAMLQRSLAVTFGGDPTIFNLDRVMRLPGFNHQKYTPVPVTFIHTGGTHSVKDLVKAAAQAPVMAVPQKEGTAAAPAPNDIFGLGISPAYEVPIELAPGDRTHKLVQHAGYLVSCGYGEEWIRDELCRMNVELCPEGCEPITMPQMEAEILGAVARFVETRRAETQVMSPPAPVAPVAPLDSTIPPPPPPPTDTLVISDDNCPDTNAEEHALEKWVDRFLYIEEGSKVADRERQGEHGIYQLQEFKNKYANVYCGPKSKLCDKWFANPYRQDVRSTIYVPVPQKIIATQGVKMWNRYCPTDVVPAIECDEEALVPFFQHLATLFPEEDTYNLFLDWMAMTITKPEIRIPWTPLLISRPGAGKGLIYRIMARVMGEHNCNMIMPDRLENQFNGFIANSTLVCIDEMKFGNKFGVSEKLKNLITESKIEVNTKQVAEKNTKVYANILIFSNQIAATYIENEDRRFWVHRIEAVPDDAHFMELWAWLDDPVSISNLLRWMQDRELAGFKFASRPPMTEAKQEMIDAGKSQMELIIEDAIDAREGPFAADVISYPTVVSFVLAANGETGLGRSEGALKQIWGRVSRVLPKEVTRVTLEVGDKRQVRVRCIRNADHWRQAGKSSIAHEATRAAQFLLTPNDVDAPELKEVK